MKKFLKELLEVFFPDPKKRNCPYCNGGKCSGACGVLKDLEKKPSTAPPGPAATDEAPKD